MSRTHVSKEALTPERMGDYEGRMAELHGYTVAFESVPIGFPPGGDAAFEGLPDNACQCPHWGYVFKGKFRARMTSGEEIIVSAGEAYYLPPGHTFECLEPLETIEFSSTKELNETLAVVGPNVERLSTSAK